MTYASSMSNLNDINNHPRHKFIKADINDKEILDIVFKKYEIDGVVNFAAESHVDNSITRPDPLYIQHKWCF